MGKPMRYVKEGDYIIRRESGAFRRVWGTMEIRGQLYVVSQYYTGAKPRLDPMPYFKSWGWEVVADQEELQRLEEKWRKMRERKVHKGGTE